MNTFTHVAKLGSFSAAAKELRISSTGISRQVAQLEEHLGVRLLQRTTRQLKLTTAGEAYLERCSGILTDLQELEDTMAEKQQRPRGRLHITTGLAFALEQFDRVIFEFVKDYPQLEVELTLTDHHLDLIAGNIDVAIRIGEFQDSSFIAKRLAPCRYFLCASPEYIASHPPITQPSDLADHKCLIGKHPRHNQWLFEGPQGIEIYRPKQGLVINNAHVVCEAAIAGLGVTYLPSFIVGSRITNRMLVPLLSKYETKRDHIYVLYPASRHLSAAVRIFIDRVSEHFSDQPPWDNY
ncbi:MAG: LysR family transcriptional regulator [Myxococcales bacterium]|nr:LysR family transcriptional regulator [Myxococcales bacterium]